MGNDESRIRLEDKRNKRFHHEEISDYYTPEEQESKRYRRMSSSRKRSRTSYGFSRSCSRSPERGRRTMSHSSRRSPSRYKIKEIESNYPEYYCKDCDCYSSGRVSWNQHIVGRRHAKNTEREVSEFYTSKKRKLVETEVKTRVHDYVPKEKLKFDDRKIDYVCNTKLKRSENVNQNLMETDHEDDNYVGLDYILVIHKHGKSVFNCFLCNIITIYKNSKQLKDHVLGVGHQRAYKEETHKSSIKIKRLKSRNPGKRSLEELIEQKLFSSNTSKRITPKSSDNPRDSRLCSNSNRKSKSFLRKTMEEVQLHNRKYELKMTSTTFRPERKLSTPASDSVFSKNSTPSRCTTASPGYGSTVSFSSFNDIASLDNSISSPVPSLKSPNILELVETLPTIEILKLLLLKLKNVEIQEKDLPFLDEVADVTADLSKKLKKQLGSALQKESMDVQESSIPLFIEVSNQYNAGEDITAAQNPPLHEERIDEQQIDDQLYSEVLFDEAVNLSTSGNKKSSSVERSTQILQESSSSSAIMNQVDQSIQPPAAFWNSLPSTQDLENILSNLPSVNLSKNSDGVYEIQLD